MSLSQKCKLGYLKHLRAETDVALWFFWGCRRGSPFRKCLPSDARMGCGVGMVTGRTLQTPDPPPTPAEMRSSRAISFYGRFNTRHNPQVSECSGWCNAWQEDLLVETCGFLAITRELSPPPTRATNSFPGGSICKPANELRDIGAPRGDGVPVGIGYCSP